LNIQSATAETDFKQGLLFDGDHEHYENVL